MTREGSSFKELHREWVSCTECGKEIQRGSLVTHRQTQHRVDKGGLVLERDESGRGDETMNYRMASPDRVGTRS